MSTQITPHFTKEDCERSSYAIAHNLENKIPDKLMPNITRLCEFMEEIRSLVCGHYGQDVKILPSSIYRGKVLNLAIKGQPTSQHCRGEAMDFHTSVGELDDVFELIEESDLEYDQLINESDVEGHHWIHASIPDEGKKARRDVLKGEKGNHLTRISQG